MLRDGKVTVYKTDNGYCIVEPTAKNVVIGAELLSDPKDLDEVQRIIDNKDAYDVLCDTYDCLVIAAHGESGERGSFDYIVDISGRLQ